MSTALEAENAEAAEEAAAALAAEEEAARDAEAADAARRSEEAAATGMTQAEREAAAEHDGQPEEAKPRRKRAPAQGNLAGGWEELIGGNEPTENKINLSGPSFSPTNAPEKIRKGATFRILVEVRATGYHVDDTLDPETHEVSSTKEKTKLRVTGGRFLEPDEYVVDGAGEAVAE